MKVDRKLKICFLFNFAFKKCLNTGCSHPAKASKMSREAPALATQLKPGGKGVNTKTGKIWRVRGQEAGQTLTEWEKNIMDAVQRKDAQESIEESEVKTIKGVGAQSITTVTVETESTLEA